MREFHIDDRLQTDCKFICDLQLCRLLLLNDNRWPWLILVPRIDQAVEIHQLNSRDQALLQVETSGVATMLAELSGCEKINSGALGNIVRQLHIHIIGRNTGDANWPGPVWGFGKRQSYSDDDSSKIIRKFRDWIVKND